eukprot:jgi/Tetstr1/441284/TSEL_029535.t1
MASSPGSGASDTTVTLPPCSCRSGYSSDCDARASDRKEPEKRKYTWGKGSNEVAESGTGKVSSQISKRTSRDCIRLMLAKEASEQSPCCSRKCVHKLYTQCGEALVDAVMDHDLGHVEIMPFHDGNSETFKKHLPPWMTKICVYYYYKSWAEDDNAILRDLATESEVKLASFDTFRRTWKEDFPDVATLKVRAKQKVHLERVRQERRDLNNAVFQSRLGHGNFFFFEIDSMDSAKTMLPHWVRIPKTVNPDMLLKYHLTCVKYDGYRPDDIYYYTNTIPHDSSTTCTLIWITIMKIFSRIGLALSRSSTYTIEAFLDLVAKAFSPTPEIAGLSFSLDFFEWLRPHFQDHIQDIGKPHKFEFTPDDAAASGGSLRTALWSNTPLSEPVQILKSAPTGTPEIRAGRPLLFALCDRKKSDAVKVQRYLDDFKKVRSYITDLAVQWHFSPVERESWKNLLDDLDEMQTAPSAAFAGFWPQRKEEVDDFLREHGQTAPAQARHTMATNADLNNAGAARVEAEVRAQVLQDDSAFRGVHAGAKERLHDNTSPSDAKGSNLVVIDVSDAIHDASGSREVFNEDGTMVRKKWTKSRRLENCCPCAHAEHLLPRSEQEEVVYIRREAKCMAKLNYPETYDNNKGTLFTSDKMYNGRSPEVCRYMSMKLNEAGHTIVGEGLSVSSNGGMLAASMAAHEMNTELHVGVVITKTFGKRGSLLGKVVSSLPFPSLTSRYTCHRPTATR